MRIIKATDYGDRVAIIVTMNPRDPQWIHPDGKAHTKATATDATGQLDPKLAPGTECHACQNNWDIRETIWDGDDLYIPNKAGARRRKTTADFTKELPKKLPPTTKVTQMEALIGTDL